MVILLAVNIGMYLAGSNLSILTWRDYFKFSAQEAKSLTQHSVPKSVLAGTRNLLKTAQNLTKSDRGKLIEKRPNQIQETSKVRDKVLKHIKKPYYTIISDSESKLPWSSFKLLSSRTTNITDKFPISCQNLCRPDSPGVLFVVPATAAPNNTKDRLAIRKTWASGMYSPAWNQTSSTRLAFFFGGSGLNSSQIAALKKESDTYGDIVVGDFHDSYGNLSLKMAVTITWVARTCPNITAAVKVDIDTFVNVKLLLRLLEELPSQTHPRYVYGRRQVHRYPPVMRTGRWAVPKADYPMDTFPAYVFGHSYVLSGPAVQIMADSIPYMRIVANEDAFITGIIPVTLNITRFTHGSFAFFAEYRDLCAMRHGYYVSQVVASGKREKLWSTFLDNRKCPF